MYTIYVEYTYNFLKIGHWYQIASWGLIHNFPSLSSCWLFVTPHLEIRPHEILLIHVVQSNGVVIYLGLIEATTLLKFHGCSSMFYLEDTILQQTS